MNLEIKRRGQAIRPTRMEPAAHLKLHCDVFYTKNFLFWIDLLIGLKMFQITGFGAK